MKYTYRDLVRMLWDTKRLAVPPRDEQGGLFSSTDPKSQYDPLTDTYIDWDANRDGDGYIRKEGDRYVIADCEGPGVIWNTWCGMAWNKPYVTDNELCIYIDGGETPVYCGNFADFFRYFQPGDWSLANFPTLMGTFSRGQNSFVPIPFQGHIKITLQRLPLAYHFTYTRFPKDTEMPHYDDRFSKDGAIALAETDRRLYRRGESPCENIAKTKTECEISVPSGKSAVLFEDKGSRAIVGLYFLHRQLRGEPAETLRKLVLKIYWDDSAVPDVCAPLSDFFATAEGAHEYRCLISAVDKQGLSCFWYMPYTAVKIVVDNHTDEEQPLFCRVECCEEPEAASLMRFHAKWHRDDWQYLDPQDLYGRQHRWPDWPVLLTKGTGRFCGMHLHVYNAWHEPQGVSKTWWYGRGSDISVGWWWGEGDEKFFVDGEKFPSTFGTGSEDYFGYAWAAEPPFALFDAPFSHNCQVPIDGNGHTSAARFQISDNVPFYKSFEGFLEKYRENIWEQKEFGTHNNKCFYAVTPYWYQLPGEHDGYAEPDPSALWGDYFLE